MSLSGGATLGCKFRVGAGELLRRERWRWGDSSDDGEVLGGVEGCAAFVSSRFGLFFSLFFSFTHASPPLVGQAWLPFVEEGDSPP